MPQAILGLLSRFILITSLTYIAHTYAGQALLRVRGRAMDLRAGLDGEDAGNTCRIVKSSPSKDVRKGALPRVPV